jgi:hypothetical protein
MLSNHAAGSRIHWKGGQESPFMTREELQTSQEYMWRALVGEQRTTLALAVEMLCFRRRPR